jgi:hypothetical protein
MTANINSLAVAISPAALRAEAAERESMRQQPTDDQVHLPSTPPGAGGSKPTTPPAPWPTATKKGEEGKKNGKQTEYVQNVLKDTPPNARQVLRPAGDTEEGTGERATVEDKEEEGTPFSGQLTQDLCEIMDMSATDNDGKETVDNSKEISLLKDKDKPIRKQRGQNDEEDEGTANARSISRPQPPKVSPPCPQPPHSKRTLKGTRSDPMTPDTSRTTSGKTMIW